MKASHKGIQFQWVYVESNPMKNQGCPSVLVSIWCLVTPYCAQNMYYFYF